jgi:hypothetical protein
MDATVLSWDAAGPPPGIYQRIEQVLIDVALDYYVKDHLKEWYDDGAANQHRAVMEVASERGLAAGFDDDYLRYFLKEDVSASTVAGTRDYAIPADCIHLVDVQLSQTGLTDVCLRRVDFGMDYDIMTYPQRRPLAGRPFWALTPDNKIRLYFGTRDTVPDAAFTIKKRYYRDVIRTRASATVDLKDPWNLGPISWAIGCAFEKQRRDPSLWYSKATTLAAAILKPPPPPSTR